MRRRAILILLSITCTATSCGSGDGGSASDEVLAAAAPATSATSISAASTSATADAPSTSDEPTPADAPTTTAEPLTAPATVVPSTGPAPAETSTTQPTSDLLADRPYEVYVPTGYDAATPLPLILLLHGYGASGDIQEAYFGFQNLAEQRGFLFVHPDGTTNRLGKQFWNATDGCCGFGSEVDDSAYLLAIIEQVSADYRVDPKRIFLAGHSNGGFMSYRMACDHADVVAAIASLAGATYADTAECSPSEPVAILQIHGTDDETIAYDGGANLGQAYPGAESTVDTWSDYNGCSGARLPAPESRDLEAGIAGSETTADIVGGCPAGGAVELWTIGGGRHIPQISADFSPSIVDFLLSHPKP